MDLSTTEAVVCGKCGNETFETVFAIRQLSEEIHGKKGIVPIPTFRCAECGYMNETFALNEKNLSGVKTAPTRH
tara:strand:- start:1080 stop:1301 length:222 start_codon:yes stop_codon:yes gene_type:complete